VVEVLLEIAHHQLPHRAVDRSAVAEAGVIALRDRPPEAMLLEDGDDMVVVAMRDEVDDERLPSADPHRRRGEERALEAVGQSVPEHPSGGTAGLAALLDIVPDVLVEKALHLARRT